MQCKHIRVYITKVEKRQEKKREREIVTEHENAKKVREEDDKLRKDVHMHINKMSRKDIYIYKAVGII